MPLAQLLVCLACPAIIIASLSTFTGNVELANKLGLQRMQTQRMLKRSLSTRFLPPNCTYAHRWNAQRSLDAIMAKNDRLRRRQHAHATLRAHLGRLNEELEMLEDLLDSFLSMALCSEWSELDQLAATIVDDYTKAIETFDLEQGMLFWAIVVAHTCGWGIVASLIYGAHLSNTKAMRAQHEAHIAQLESSRLVSEAERRRFQRNILDHRFGNRVRQARLHFEEKQFGELEAIIKAWEYESDIRQGNYSNLPTTAIKPKTLFDEVFSFHYTMDCFCESELPLLFFDSLGKQIAYPIIQVAILQDVASNVMKHGGARAHVVVCGHKIVVANCIIKNPSLPQSNSIGLKALENQAAAFNLQIAFEADSGEFRTILQVSCEPKSVPETRMVEPIPIGNSWTQYNQFTWLYVEDSQTTALLTAKQYKKVGINLKTLIQASDVSGLENIVAEMWHCTGKSVVVILDENIFTINEDYNIAPETGTNVRRRFLSTPASKKLIDDGHVYFVSCSASVVTDDENLICKIGKSVPPRQQIPLIWKALCDAEAPLRKESSKETSLARYVCTSNRCAT